jgi:hypothetical protein
LGGTVVEAESMDPFQTGGLLSFFFLLKTLALLMRIFLSRFWQKIEYMHSQNIDYAAIKDRLKSLQPKNRVKRSMLS